MKARAWILMLLIGMIGFTGFGETTSDLIQNSETKAIVSQDVTIDLASVVTLDVLVQDVFLIKLNQNSNYQEPNEDNWQTTQKLVSFKKENDEVKVKNPISHFRYARDGLTSHCLI